MAGGNFWTKEEVEILTKEYHKPLEDLRKLLSNRTRDAIIHKAIRLNQHKIGAPWKVHLKPSNVRQLSEFWRGYIAGIIDGEGTITISKFTKSQHGMLHPKISIGNTNLNCLKKIEEVIGSGHTTLHERRGRPWKDCWEWKTSSVTDVKTLLTQLKDAFFIKREQASLVLKFCELYVSRPCYSSEPTSEMIQLYEGVKELNRRGQTS